MTMPGMSGEELIFEARKLNPGIRCILCTGYSHVLTARRIERMKLDAFLQKPVPRDELLRKIAEILHKNRPDQ